MSSSGRGGPAIGPENGQTRKRNRLGLPEGRASRSLTGAVSHRVAVPNTAGKLPFTRSEMQVLCWFPGYLLAGAAWHLASNAASQDILQTPAFNVVSQSFNVVLYTIFFYLSLAVVLKLNNG